MLFNKCTQKPLRDVAQRNYRLQNIQLPAVAPGRYVELFEEFEEIVWDDPTFALSATVSKPNMGLHTGARTASEGGNPRQQVCRWS